MSDVKASLSNIIQQAYAKKIEDQLRYTMIVHPDDYDYLKNQVGGVNLEVYEAVDDREPSRSTDSSDGAVTWAVRGR